MLIESCACSKAMEAGTGQLSAVGKVTESNAREVGRTNLHKIFVVKVRILNLPKDSWEGMEEISGKNK